MISVLTVNYHSSDDLAQLVDSLRRHVADHEIELIVTNNSPDDSVAVPAGLPFPMTVLPADNIGFGPGINLAYRRARGDVLFVTNPDVRITPKTFDRATRYLGHNSDVGILLPLLRHPNGDIQVSARRFYTWPVVLYARSPLRALGYQPMFFRRYLYHGFVPSRPRDVDWGLGGAMFLRNTDVGPKGIFDERFFLYFEDVDLCYRTWLDKRRVVYHPQVECIHAHRRSSRRVFSRAAWYHFQSLLKFIAKHRCLPQRPRGRTHGELMTC